METLGYILAAITLIYIWSTKKNDLLMYEVNEVTMAYKSKFFEWIGTHKPFNCDTCLTIWFAIPLFLYFDYQLFFLPLPLYYKLVTKYL